MKVKRVMGPKLKAEFDRLDLDGDDRISFWEYTHDHTLMENEPGYHHGDMELEFTNNLDYLSAALQFLSCSHQDEHPTSIRVDPNRYLSKSEFVKIKTEGCSWLDPKEFSEPEQKWLGSFVS